MSTFKSIGIETVCVVNLLRLQFEIPTQVSKLEFCIVVMFYKERKIFEFVVEISFWDKFVFKDTLK